MTVLAGCTVVVLLGGGFVEQSPSPNLGHLAGTGARVIVQGYPLNDAPAAYASVDRPRSVVLGESAGGAIAAWAAARGRVRAAVTVGAPFDFRFWEPAHAAFHGQPWRWSPRRVYRGQRPLTAIHWTVDPFVDARQSHVRGARRVLLDGFGHIAVPREVLLRELRRACATPRIPRATPQRSPSDRHRMTRPSRGSTGSGRPARAG
jgi:acetyl esterase/lipase